MTTPVNVLSLTFDEVHEAARARTACTAMYLLISFDLSGLRKLTIPEH
jgi:hypothetical protein